MRCDCAEQLQESLRRIHCEGGLLLHMPHNEGRGIGLLAKMRAYNAQDTLGLDTYEANVHLHHPEDARTYAGVAAVLQRHYDVPTLRLLTNSKRKVAVLRKAGLDIVGVEPVHVRPTEYNRVYIQSKRLRSLQLHKPNVPTSISAAVRALRTGRPIVVVDDADRENEGDIIFAAGCVSESDIAFLLEHTSGVLCCAVTEERARKLELPPMVHKNEDARETAYTVSIDLTNSSTGISAFERAQVCRALADAQSCARTFKRPGHVFPLVAKAGGVCTRRGHTEASVDLCRLAGVPPVAVLAEVVTPDRKSMAKRMDLEWLAHEHHMPLVTIDALARVMRKVRPRLSRY